jgi:hypothetical protein
MALFGSKEEKEAKAAAKAQADLEKLAAKYNLDLNAVDPASLSNLKNISSALAGTGFLSAGTALTVGNDQKAFNQIQSSYLQSIFEQNWMILRELQKLNQK